MVYMQQLFSTNSSRFIILSKVLHKRQFFEMGYLNHLDVISDLKYIKYQKINFVKKTLIFNIFLAPPISTGNSTEGKQITGMFQSFCSLFYVVCICKKAYSLRQHQQFRYFHSFLRYAYSRALDIVLMSASMFLAQFSTSPISLSAVLKSSTNFNHCIVILAKCVALA